jgi:haloalkane dehalogenase
MASADLKTRADLSAVIPGKTPPAARSFRRLRQRRPLAGSRWSIASFAFRAVNRKRFEAAFPKHRTVLFDDASHFLQEDVGERIAEAFKAFDREPPA